MQYLAAQWRKRLERKRRGWRRFTSAQLPNCVIEFHIIHQGRIYSGRHHATHLTVADVTTPGTAAYILRRKDLMLEGVWRRASNQHAATGMVCRAFP